MEDRLNPSQIGNIIELKCQIFLIEHGWNVLVPVGNYLKYDLVIEKGGRFYRIQCKHATGNNECFIVRTKYEVRDKGKVRKESYTENDCDYFMTEYEGTFYIFPIWGTTETKFWMHDVRLASCKLAKDYVAEHMLSSL
jgi:hypothetical protein